LYAQKLWNFVLPKLIEGDKDALGELLPEGSLIVGKGRLAYLVAFSSLLPLIPAALCLSDLERVRTPSTIEK
jgi:DNA repair/transcription protein MET18/MMS19